MHSRPGLANRAPTGKSLRAQLLFFWLILMSRGTLFAQGYGTTSAQGGAFETTRIGASADAAQAVFPGPRGPDDAVPRPDPPR